MIFKFYLFIFFKYGLSEKNLVWVKMNQRLPKIFGLSEKKLVWAKMN